MPKIAEKIKLPEHGHGSILRYEGVTAWYSKFSHHGKEHVESLGTDDRKKALAAHRAKVKLLGAADLSFTEFQSSEPEAQGHDRPPPGRLHHRLHHQEVEGAAPGQESRGHHPDALGRESSSHDHRPRGSQADRSLAGQRGRGRYDQPQDPGPQRGAVLGKRNKLVVGDVPEFTRLSEAGNARQGYFKPEQVSKLLKHLPDYLRDLVEFTALVGWRPKSSRALRWATVDVKGKTITIGTSKNGQAQVLPIAGPLLGLLQRREKARLYTAPDGTPGISEYVFHRGGQPIGDYRKAWASALKGAGLPQGMLFYDLKRTAARGLRKQVDEQTCMAVMGQKTAAIFQRYRIVDTEDKAAALKTLEAFAR